MRAYDRLRSIPRSEGVLEFGKRRTILSVGYEQQIVDGDMFEQSGNDFRGAPARNPVQSRVSVNGQALRLDRHCGGPGMPRQELSRFLQQRG